MERFDGLDADGGEQQQQQSSRKRRVAVLPPKGGAGGSSATPMSAVQRRATAQKAKNAVKGLAGKHKAAEAAAAVAAAKRGGAVTVDDDDNEYELIDEDELDDDADCCAHEHGQHDHDDAGSDGAASNSDDDGIQWDTPAQRQAKKLAAAQSAVAAARSPVSWWQRMRGALVWVALLLFAAGVVYFKLQDSTMWGMADAEELVSRPPAQGEDLYTVLEVARTASAKDIKASYRKLVMSAHPDKNPNCADCPERFQRIQQAYDTLGNADKRAMYDSVESTFDVLQSAAVDLTSANMDTLVLQRDDVWVIQVYTDWHKSAIRFSNAWEEAISWYGSLVRFGRVHAAREQALARQLPVKFGVIPSVLIYANGQFRDTKAFRDSSAAALPKLARFIAQQFPNTVISVPNDKDSIHAFMTRAKDASAGSPESERPSMLFVPDFVKQAALARKEAAQAAAQQGGDRTQQARFRAQMLATDTERVNAPSLTLKSIARRFQYSFTFGQVAQLDQPDAWKAWLKALSASVKLKPPTQLPALLYQEDATSAPVWLSGDLGKTKLSTHLDTLHRRLVPTFNSHSYARHCATGTDTSSPDMDKPTSGSSQQASTCVLAVACTPLAHPARDFQSFVRDARALRNAAWAKSARLQFAKVDVAVQSDLAPLCAALPRAVRNASELVYMSVADTGATLYYSRASARPLDAWLQRVLRRDEQVASLPAPHVPTVHIPDDVVSLLVPGLSAPVLLPLRWLYGGAIVVSLWMFAPLISRHFGTFLILISALSMALPAFELLKDVYAKYA